MDKRLKQISTVLTKEAHFRKNPQMAKLSKYVEMENNRYYLDLSKRECQNLGISLSEYDKMVFELRKTNQYLAQQGKGLNFTPKPFPNSATNQGAIKGSMETDGPNQEFARGWAPLGATHARFKCTAHGSSPRPLYYCTTKSQGVTKTESAWGRNVTIDVLLTTSNEFIELSFKTSEGSGGICDWEFIKK